MCLCANTTYRAVTVQCNVWLKTVNLHTQIDPVIKMTMRALFSIGILNEKSKEALSNNNEEKLGAPD